MESKKSDNYIFRQFIEGIPEMRALKSQISGERPFFYSLNGLTESARALFLYAISSDIDKKLVVLSREQDARALFDEYRSYDRECRYYPGKDLLFYGADLRSNELTTERIRIIRDVLKNDQVTVFTTIDALLGKLPSVDSFRDGGIVINTGDNINLDELSQRLLALGYNRTAMVSEPGDFCIRGGIFDVFPLTELLPFRAELWGDEIDSIRYFDADTQKSIENIEHATLFPASEEVLFSGDNNNLLPDFFDSKSCIFLDDPKRLSEIAKASYDEFMDGMRGRLLAGLASLGTEEIMATPDEVFSAISSHKGIALSNLEDQKPPVKIEKFFSVDTRPVISFNNSIPLLKKEIKRYKKDGYSVVLCGQSRTRQRRLWEGLYEDGLECFFAENAIEPIGSRTILITVAALSKGVEFPDAKMVYISENDIFGGVYKRKKKKAYKKGDAIESFRDLSVGDYVVHENYGLGIYQGIEKIEQDKITKDFLKISYAGTDNLFVPVSQLESITKYAGGDAKVKLSSLSGSEWKKTKSRVKAAVTDMAKELVDLYSLRQQERGYAYGPDTAWQQEFEETFPYEETPGQIAAIDDVKSDLMSNKIMDRLVCGDVGFGKTEVAIRAAFKVVQENKQVVVLVPTTVLAQQHYNTFTERMKDYPVNIGLLSRFRTTNQNAKTAKQLGTGELDIVIGTHRALSKDVQFKDLGLLVIDEEQRFGVRHKEKIKQLKNQVDVLSLTATPIPRTLHMSLIGIRDMSLLDEAPLERQPIQTFVFEQNDEMVREAIERELARGGQVYYVVNRIRQIPEIADRIKSLVPKAQVVYAHGRMNENSLEDIMNDFVEREIDVLVATTIIEIGLDISNVNTIIIHDADNFGLSQLYQLRGRVGRSNRTAYAFLMYRRDKLLKEVAEKRLSAIREFSDLGSGFKIAMRDLEIRGAGNLLGSEQHGHMEAVGYDLYCKMLSMALKTERGETIDFPEFETAIDIMTDAYIPTGYIPDEAQKLEIYKRISLINDDESEEIMIDELIDRFGDPPKAIVNLIHIARLRHLAHSAYITKIFQSQDTVKLDILPNADINPANIPLLIKRYEGSMKFTADPLAPSISINSIKPAKSNSIISYMREVIEDIYNVLIRTG